MWPQQFLSTLLLLIAAAMAWPSCTEGIIAEPLGNAALSGSVRAQDTSANNTTNQHKTWLHNGTIITAAGTFTLPYSKYYCNSSSDTIDHALISDIISLDVASSSLTSLVPQGGGSIWSHAPADGLQGTQMWVCNFNEYDMAHNVAQFNRVNDILNDKCGDAGGGIHFYEWQLSFGRDITNEDGSFREGLACSYKG